MLRAKLLATACVMPMLLSTAASAQQRVVRPARSAPVSPRPAPSGIVTAIEVQGNQRIEPGTIRSYMLIQPGDPYDPDRIDRSLKSLFSTGLFQDVSFQRQGGTLIVKVVENPIINRIAFEGNRKLTDDQLQKAIQLKSRSVYTPQLVQADRQRMLNAYAKAGRYGATVDPKIIRLDQNRVDVVFEINEGATTLVSRIAIVGNHAFSENRLREVIASREEAFYRFLSNADQYDPERVSFDKELLRRFYLKNGFADFEVKSATAELTPDRSAFLLTFVLNEGERYTVGKVDIDSKLRNLDPATLTPLLGISTGDTYDGDAVEKTSQALQDAIQSAGLRLRRGQATDRARQGETHGRPRLRHRRGAAGLCRADRHLRQHPHQRQGDPARVPYCRGRCVRRRFGPPGPSAATGSGLLQ